ncbi:MAG TPA: S41 family peptidase [Longimicrobiales bacterium]|nr:S41 family peptidase [Longimicrobiales bacterium]
MRVKRTILAPLTVAAIALATGGWFLQRGVGEERTIYATAQLLQEVVDFVSHGFVDKHDEGDLYRMAIDGMLQGLGDPHTGFMPAAEYENLRIATEGEYGGLGISIAKRNGWVTVITPLPGTPGERAGLRAGDQIIEVNGESTKGWSDDQAVARLRGPRGSPVDIKVARVGADEPIAFRIVRDEIHIKAVPTKYMVSPGIGYVEMNVFSESSTDELRGAIQELRQQGAKGIVLDMRQNSGGLLDQGVSVSDLFLERGDMVVETRSRVPSQNQRLNASKQDEFPGVPIVVLIGPGSASATEIVAGALQDHDRALILGQTSYGKGSVQTLYRLPDNNWLKLTTARWFTPSGRSIQGPYGIDHPVELGADGIDPDASVEDTTRERPEYRTESGRTVLGGGGITPDLIVSHDTLSAAERALVEVLVQDHAATYAEARFAFGVRYAEAHAELQPGFTVTPAMLDEFYQGLVEGGVRVDRTVYDGAQRWVAAQIGDEVTVSKWGVAEVRKRSNTRDVQVNRAVGLLQRASTPESLFELAAAEAATLKTAGR